MSETHHQKFRGPGRPNTYVYPKLAVGQTEEFILFELCTKMGKGNMRSARNAILRMAKRKGHDIETEIIKVIDYECINNKRELLRITRVK